MSCVLSRYIDVPVQEDNPWSDDVTGKLEEYAEFLTTAMAADPRSFVLCVDAPWGLGKTFFVRRWSQTLKGSKGFHVVEFNAWESDTAEEPLLPFAAAVTEQLGPKLDGNTETLNKVKKTAGKIALRGGGILVRAALRRVLGDEGLKDIRNLFDSETEGELADLAGGLVDNQVAKAETRTSFREELGEMVAALPGEEPFLFVFVDELDRCNPRFAIDLLERIKHLFDIDYIKFVISVDSIQLAHSIRGAYGHEFDATTYLQRFFDQTFSLPKLNASEFAQTLCESADFEQLSQGKFVIAGDNGIAAEFAELSECFGLTLRQQQQISARLEAILPNIHETQVLFSYLIALTMFRLCFPKDYRQYIDQACNPEVWRRLRENETVKGSKAMELIDDYMLWASRTQDQLRQKLEEVRQSLPRTPSNLEEQNLRNRAQVLRKVFTSYSSFCRYPEYVEMATLLTGENGT